MANKGGTAETIAFSSFYIRTGALFFLHSANVLVAKAKRQLQIFSVRKRSVSYICFGSQSEAAATITPRQN
ncbi:hypothetical protein [Lysinibacillus sp. TE18511]